MVVGAAGAPYRSAPPGGALKVTVQMSLSKSGCTCSASCSGKGSSLEKDRVAGAGSGSGRIGVKSTVAPVLKIRFGPPNADF